MNPPPQVAPTLDVLDVFKSSVRDAFPLIRSRARLWLLFSFVIAGAGFALSFVPAATPADLKLLHEPFHTWRHRAGLTYHVQAITDVVSSFFVVGTAFRTVRPGWRWTVALFFGYVFLTLVAAAPLVAVQYLIAPRVPLMVSSILFVPAGFLTVKLWWAPWCFCLATDETSSSSLGRSPTEFSGSACCS